MRAISVAALILMFVRSARSNSPPFAYKVHILCSMVCLPFCIVPDRSATHTCAGRAQGSRRELRESSGRKGCLRRGCVRCVLNAPISGYVLVIRSGRGMFVILHALLAFRWTFSIEHIWSSFERLVCSFFFKFF